MEAQDIKGNMEEAIRSHLARVGTGIPLTDAFWKLLHMSLTDEELEVILGLPTKLPPFEVEDVDTIAQRLGMEAEKAEKALESLSKKNYAFRKITDSGKPGYAFIQLGFGIPQVPLWEGKDTPAARQMAEVFYNKKDLLARGADAPTFKVLERCRGTEEKKRWRYIPVDRSVDFKIQGVLPCEELTRLIEKVEVIAQVHCPCRVARDLIGDRECDHSTDVCLKFNQTARFIIERGLGREISKEEAVRLVRKAEDERLIHFVDNCTEDIQHNCNCCPCCCWNTFPIANRLVPRDFFIDTYFLRKTDMAECTGCLACVDTCPLKMITAENDYPVVDESVCVGCGNCLSVCPTGAAWLQRREDKELPSATFRELHERQLIDTWGSVGEKREKHRDRQASTLTQTHRQGSAGA